MIRLLAFLLLFPAAGFPLSRIWEANLALPGRLMGFETAAPEDTSMLPYAGDYRFALYRGGFAWSGHLRREAVGFQEAAEGHSRHSLMVRPIPETELGLTWSETLERNRLTDPGRLDVRLGENRRALGLEWIQHVLPGPRILERRAGEPFLDVSVSLPDLRRQAFAWTLAGGQRGSWSLEYGLAHGDVREDVVVENLDTSGAGEIIRGEYRMRTASHRLVASVPLAGGHLGLMGAYGEGRPKRPEGEFWFSDSSRRVDGAFSYGRPFGLGEWQAHAAFKESEAVTLGRRIPPGSEGLKRFHFARSHAQLWELGGSRSPEQEKAASGMALPGVTEGLRAGLTYRNYSWKSSPSPDALKLRDETLSYNRLGLSIIANLYGGLFKESEIIGGNLHAGTVEAHGDWLARLGGGKSGGSSGGKSGGKNGGAIGRSGSWEGSAGGSLHYTGLDLKYQGHTLSQRVLSVDTSAAYGRSFRGYIAGATPRLSLGWSLGRFRLEAAAAQFIPLIVELEEPGKGSAGKSGGSGARYPLFRNGFTARLGIQAGY